MALPVIADVVRATFNWTSTLFPETFHNVMHFDVSSGATLVQLAANINAAGNADMAEGSGGGYHPTSVSLLPLDGTAATSEFAVTTIPAASTADFIPAQAAIVSLRTGIRGRSHRGRVFIPAMTEAAATAGVLTTSVVTDLGTGWVAFINDMGTATPSTPMVVASYKLATADNVTGVVIRSHCGTMRRRQDARR